MKPVIGMNTSLSTAGSKRPHFFLSANYTHAVWKAGGIPLLLTAPPEVADIESYLDRIQGLILVGGPDIDPSVYGDGEALPTVTKSPAVRQDFDLALAGSALERDLPILGICMGCQVLNVASGGTLFQDISYQFRESRIPHRIVTDPCYTFHQIRIAPGSFLHRLYGREEIEVDSAHHQSVMKPGRGFKPIAWSEDGVIECIEHETNRFAVGVQWHPEIIHERPDQLSLFSALVSASSGQEPS